MKKLKTYQLAVQFYNNSKNLYLKEPLKNQFQRAVLSIVLNLAEGGAKPSSKERQRFYRISLGVTQRNTSYTRDHKQQNSHNSK